MEDIPDADRENTAEFYFATLTSVSHLAPSFIQAVTKQTQHILGRDVQLNDVMRLMATNTEDLVKALCGFEYASEDKKSSTGHDGTDPIIENNRTEEQETVEAVGEENGAPSIEQNEPPAEEKGEGGEEMETVAPEEQDGASNEQNESPAVEVKDGDESQEMGETPALEENGAHSIEQSEENGEKIDEVKEEPVVEVAEQSQTYDEQSHEEETQETEDQESSDSTLNRTYDVEVSSLPPEAFPLDDKLSWPTKEIAPKKEKEPRVPYCQPTEKHETPSEKAPEPSARGNLFAVVGDHPGQWDPSLSEDDLHLVTIPRANDPNDLYVAQHFENGENPMAKALTDWMNNYDGKAEDLPVPLEDVVAGLPVAVITDDDLIERGIVVSTDLRNHSVTVSMIDKGLTKTTPCYNIFHIAKSLMSPAFPAQAIHCTVAVNSNKFLDGKPLWPKQCIHSLARAVRTETVYTAMFSGQRADKTVVNLYLQRYGCVEKKSFLYHVAKYLALWKRIDGTLSPAASMLSLFGDSTTSQSDMDSTLNTSYEEDDDTDKTLEDDEATPQSPKDYEDATLG